LTFYWHDYETFGTDPQRDRPAQFAGVRTDADFNLIGEPLVIYCQVPLDYLPQPESCLITGITPQQANQKGLPEAEFIGLIHRQLAQPNTCGVGYNTIRFDDEVTRNCLYRNFYDPYAREWQNGNSRWDLLDVIRAARALRPEGIHWPTDSDGLPTLRLDQLTRANEIAHESAHDALSDVYATISIAKLLRQAQPKLYQFLFAHRGKREALQLLKLGEHQPVVHVSGKYPTVNNNLAIVVAICQDPKNNNGVLVYDLSIDPEPMLSLSAEEIRKRVFTARQDLPEGVERIPLKTVHLNKCPVLAPISVIKDSDCDRLRLDLAVCDKNLQKIKSAVGLPEKIAAVHGEPYTHQEKMADPDLAIYSGGFFSDNDKREMAKIRAADCGQLPGLELQFADRRLQEMFFRYKARNYPSVLSATESEQWQTHCLEFLSDEKSHASVHFDAYFSILAQWESNQQNFELASALREFGNEKLQKLGG